MDKAEQSKWRELGVTIENAESVVIEPSVTIGRGTVISANNRITGNCVIGEDVFLDIGNSIDNSVIAKGCKLQESFITDSEIGEYTTVGPFANVKAKSKIGAHCRIGNFVEIKNSTLGNGCKAAHLAYIGDCTLGELCNVGCGVIFINYDGEKKHRSTIGNKVFVGSNSNVIAPVTVGDGAYIAAGSTVDIDLPEHCLCIGRSRPIIKEWRSKYNPQEVKK